MAELTPIRLVLFDIDGTLLDCGPQVRGVIHGTLRKIFGRVGNVAGYDFVGKTDTQIVLDLQQEAGIPRDEILDAMPELKTLYVETLEGALEADRMRLLPAVVETLDRLSARPDVTLALLTGNWEGGARIKLSRFDLNRYFPFGAFGDGHEDRLSLPPEALARAGEHTGRSYAAEESLIVGDSTLDVDCARANGLLSLAVATGKTPIEILASTEADWVVEDLSEAPSGVPIFAA